jgi:uncharacterized protein
MRTMALRTTDGRWIATNVRMACTLTSRSLGLSAQRMLEEEDGLLLTPAASAHTLGLRYPIDVVFLSPRMKVIGLAPALAPWRFRIAPAGTGRVLELVEGRIRATGLTIGAYLLAEYPGPEGSFVATCPIHSRAVTQVIEPKSS